MELIVFVKHADKPFNGHWAHQHGKHGKPYQDRIARVPMAKRTPELITKLERSYDAVAIPGDVVEQHEDGWWDNIMAKNPNNKMKDSFACIRVPDQNINYVASLRDNDGNIIKNHRYNVKNNYTLGQVTIHATLDIEDKNESDKKNKQWLI